MEFSVVTDHKILTEFYISCGLEIENGWEKEMNPIKSIAVFENNKILCAATISKRFDKTVLDYIGVIPSMQKKGIGKILFNEITKDRGEIYITAKNQGFFKKLGFSEIDDSDLLAECSLCPQKNVNCFPKAMKRG